MVFLLVCARKQCDVQKITAINLSLPNVCTNRKNISFFFPKET
jgi:hypothetical protein